jgi:hypothetical protein
VAASMVVLPVVAGSTVVAVAASTAVVADTLAADIAEPLSRKQQKRLPPWQPFSFACSPTRAVILLPRQPSS